MSVGFSARGVHGYFYIAIDLCASQIIAVATAWSFNDRQLARNGRDLLNPRCEKAAAVKFENLNRPADAAADYTDSQARAFKPLQEFMESGKPTLVGSPSMPTIL